MMSQGLVEREVLLLHTQCRTVFHYSIAYFPSPSTAGHADVRSSPAGGLEFTVLPS